MEVALVAFFLLGDNSELAMQPQPWLFGSPLQNAATITWAMSHKPLPVELPAMVPSEASHRARPAFAQAQAAKVAVPAVPAAQVAVPLQTLQTTLMPQWQPALMPNPQPLNLFVFSSSAPEASRAALPPCNTEEMGKPQKTGRTAETKERKKKQKLSKTDPPAKVEETAKKAKAKAAKAAKVTKAAPKSAKDKVPVVAKRMKRPAASAK